MTKLIAILGDGMSLTEKTIRLLAEMDVVIIQEKGKFPLKDFCMPYKFPLYDEKTHSTKFPFMREPLKQNMKEHSNSYQNLKYHNKCF